MKVKDKAVTQIELRDCPFCGSPAMLEENWDWIHGNVIVRCTLCRILTHPGPRNKVIQAWNKRTRKEWDDEKDNR